MLEKLKWAENVWLQSSERYTSNWKDFVYVGLEYHYLVVKRLEGKKANSVAFPFGNWILIILS